MMLMQPIAKYIHGSEDSLDIDVVYVFNEMPSFQECQAFCSEKEENRNIVVINQGIVKDCFKGTVDEINNGLFRTYNLHPQDFPLLITKRVHRDLLLKMVRVIRCILSHCSRTQYRTEVKKALKSQSWIYRLRVLEKINFEFINDFGKSGKREDVLKTFAFQIGQLLGLLEGLELYTKSEVALQYPFLTEFLYRKEDAEVYYLMRYLKILLQRIQTYKTESINGETIFQEFNKKMDLVREKYIE